jgi:hypothetical protein
MTTVNDTRRAEEGRGGKVESSGNWGCRWGSNCFKQENRFSITYKLYTPTSTRLITGVSMLQPVLFYLLITYVPYLFLVIFNLASL